MSVDLLNSTTKASISEGKVVDVSVGPVFLSGVVHDFFKSGIDNVDLRGARKLSHVRRVGGNGVTHHLQESLVLLFLVLLGHATGSDMGQVLQPLEVRAGNTTSIGEHVGNDNNSLGIENFLSHEGSRTVSSFQDNLALESVSVLVVDGLLLGSGDEDVTRHFHEGGGVGGLNCISVAVVGESTFSEHLSSNIIDIKTGFVVDGGVVLNDTNNDTSVSLEELSSPVADSTKALDDKGLSRDSLSSKLGGLDERVGSQELSDAVVDTKTGTLSTSLNTALVNKIGRAHV